VIYREKWHFRAGGAPVQAADVAHLPARAGVRDGERDRGRGRLQPGGEVGRHPGLEAHLELYHHPDGDRLLQRRARRRHQKLLLVLTDYTEAFSLDFHVFFKPFMCI